MTCIVGSIFQPLTHFCLFHTHIQTSISIKNESKHNFCIYETYCVYGMYTVRVVRQMQMTPVSCMCDFVWRKLKCAISDIYIHDTISLNIILLLKYSIELNAICPPPFPFLPAALPVMIATLYMQIQPELFQPEVGFLLLKRSQFVI